MREIKFRQAIFVNEKFDSWHYWGFFKDGFVGPVDVCIREAEKNSYQFTGLKDKNGKEIYEGDIMQWYNACVPKGSSPLCKEIVVWNEKRLRFEGCWSGEIIGNIHDNPKLLETK